MHKITPAPHCGDAGSSTTTLYHVSDWSLCTCPKVDLGATLQTGADLRCLVSGKPLLIDR